MLHNTSCLWLTICASLFSETSSLFDTPQYPYMIYGLYLAEYYLSTRLFLIGGYSQLQSSNYVTHQLNPPHFVINFGQIRFQVSQYIFFLPPCCMIHIDPQDSEEWKRRPPGWETGPNGGLWADQGRDGGKEKAQGLLKDFPSPSDMIAHISST